MSISDLRGIIRDGGNVVIDANTLSTSDFRGMVRDAQNNLTIDFT